MVATVEQIERVDQIREGLRHFTGSEKVFRHTFGQIVYTQGVQWLAQEAGAYWLVDAIASHQPNIKRFPNPDFQIWVLTLGHSGSKAVLRCGNDMNGDDTMTIDAGKEQVPGAMVTQRIPFTDFPLPEIKLYLVDWTLMLPS